MPDFGSQDPSSFGWARGDQADIVPFQFRGHPFPSGVARLAAPLFSAVLSELLQVPGFRLRESRGLDAGMWGYQDRRKGGGGGWSFHAYGLAIDVNAPDNPMSSRTPPDTPYRLPLATAAIARRHGVLWGGGPQGFGDWMHLEVHMSPQEIRDTWKPAAAVAGGPGAYPLPARWWFGPSGGPLHQVSGVHPSGGPIRDQIKRIQKKLGVAIDGAYGPITGGAVRTYQLRHGLEADGLVGPLTWASLRP